MAIYFEDKILHPKKDGNELEKFYWEGMQRINKLYEKNGEFVILRRNVREEWDNKHENKKNTPAYALPSVLNIYIEEFGAITIRYSPNVPTRTDKTVTYIPARIFIEDLLVIPKKNKDLAWFIIEASNYVAESREKVQGSKFLYLDDPVKDVEVHGQDLRKYVKLDYYLLDEDSPVYNKKDIIFIADKFGFTINEGSLLASATLLRDSIISAEKNGNPDITIPNVITAIKKLIAKNNIEDDLPESPYDLETLKSLSQKSLNLISDKMGTQKVPRVKRSKQVELILEKQNNEVEV